MRRLTNCLNGFTDLVKVNISNNEPDYDCDRSQS